MLFYIFVFSSGSIWYNFSLLYHSWILYYILTAIDELKNLKSIQLSLGICGESAATPWTEAPPGSSVHRSLQARYLMGCHSLLQWIFPTEGLNPCPWHCRQILYHLSHQGSPQESLLLLLLLLLSRFSRSQLCATP